MSLHFAYMLLDAARLDNRLAFAFEMNSGFQSLYRGESEKDLASVAPYLFCNQPNERFNTWYFRNGWGNAWGILVSTSASFEETHKHFRKFLLVKTEQGKELYFRFYDPRVLRIFLPSCDAQQLKEFFGPIEQFICEDEDPAFGLVFSLEGNNLKTVRSPKGDLFEISGSETEDELSQIEES